MVDREDDADKKIRADRESTNEALTREREAVDALVVQGRHEAEPSPAGWNCGDRDLVRIFSRFLEERTWTDERLRLERERTDEVIRGLIEPELLKRAEDEALAMSEFLAIVSHDLRNPLASIEMAAEALAFAETDQKTTRELARLIRQASEGMLVLIADLLDSERIRSGRIFLTSTSIDLAALIQEMVDMLQLLARRRSLQLGSHLPREPLVVSCDRPRMAQVLTNLLENALKFTPHGGSIDIALESSETQIQVSVKDTGPGIERNLQERIFERFNQVANKDRRGLGLGLYISRGIVEAHGGRIWVESLPERGSNFQFTLPRNASS